MSDKTCGTCSHGLRNIVYCETNNPNANTAGLHGAGERACKYHAERTDSVEQVARDAVRLLDECWTEHRRPFSIEIGKLMIRLEELGVDV